MRRVPLLLAVVFAVATAPRSARAGATTPALVLSTAAASAGTAGRTAVFQGSFDFANALQIGYAIDLVVFQGTTFARYPFAGAPLTGTSPQLSDGTLAAGEVATLVGEGAPADAGVEIVTLTADEIRVNLPASFVGGPATAVVFAVLSDGTALSNAIGFVLP